MSDQKTTMNGTGKVIEVVKAEIAEPANDPIAIRIYVRGLDEPVDIPRGKKTGYKIPDEEKPGYCKFFSDSLTELIKEVDIIRVKMNL